MNGNGFFHDTDGGLSMMRMLTFLVVVAIVVVWAIMCFIKGDLLDIPGGVLGVLITALAGKFLQKGVEVFGAIKQGGEAQ